MISDSSSYIVGDAPDEVGNPIDLPVTHAIFAFQKLSIFPSENTPFPT
jgi:hypothetical protein